LQADELESIGQLTKELSRLVVAPSRSVSAKVCTLTFKEYVIYSIQLVYNEVNPLTPTVAIWVYLSINHPVPDRVKP